jgi:hypothetical protein
MSLTTVAVAEAHASSSSGSSVAAVAVVAAVAAAVAAVASTAAVAFNIGKHYMYTSYFMKYMFEHSMTALEVTSM